MSQNDFNIANQGFPSFRSDLNSALQALASNSAGTSAPATTYAYMLWYDSTNNILKMRNADNDGWIDFASFDQATDTWSFASVVIDGDLAVDTNTLFVDSTNNRVGVGTTSPAYPLDVYGHNAIRGANAQFWFNSDNTNFSGIYNAGSTGAGNGNLVVETNGTERMRIDASGNVGIGTSSPTQKVTVDGNVFASTGDGGGFILEGGSGIYRQGTFGMGFNTNGTERMRIDASGNVFVGGVNYPNITGGGGFGFSVNPASSQIAIGHNSSGANGTYYVYFTHAGNVIGSITQSGTTSVSYNTSSDYRLKEDVQPMVGASQRVLALNPVNFAWKSSGARVDGFLAHELQEVVPEAATGAKDAVDEDGKPIYQGIDQSKLVPLLTAALQEALTEISALKDRVAALEA